MTLLEQEQADMRKRWAAPAYRLEQGSSGGTLPTAELTLGATDLNTEELLRRIEDAHDRYQQGISEGLPSISCETCEATEDEGEEE